MWARWKAKGAKVLPGLIQLAAAILIGLVFFLGIQSERTGFVAEVIDPGFRKLRDPVLNAFRAKPPNVDLIQLQLEDASYDSLMGLSGSALRDRLVRGQGNAAFKATVLVNDREVPVVIGLREGAAIPSVSGTWPLHVRALPGDTVLHMQTFDIVPVTNNAPLWSMLLHGMLKDAGHASLQSAVAEVELNGHPLGLCMLQGRPDRTMLNGWSRGNGPVLRFDDALRLDTRAVMEARRFPSTPPGQGDWMVAPLLLQSVEGDVLSGRAQKAIERMDAFRSGILDPSDVFDTEHVARLLALCELLGTHEAVDWWNLRFLVDSISDDLIPIPLHIMHRAPIEGLMVAERNVDDAGREVVQRFLADPKIRNAYVAYLDTISAAGWWEHEIARISQQWTSARKVINAEFPIFDLDTNVLAHDRTIIQQALFPKTSILAYVRDAQRSGDGIAVANVHNIPVDVLGVVWSSGDSTLRNPMQLPPRARDRPLQYAIIPIPDLDISNAPTKVLVRIAGLPLRGEPIRTWSSFGAN